MTLNQKQRHKLVRVQIVPPLKRKFFSAIWRFNQLRVTCYQNIIRFVVQALCEKYWLLDYLAGQRPTQPSVLLIRLDLLGDFVLWLDAAQSYKRLYPKHKITLVVNHICVELAQALPYWDEVIGINVGQLRSNDVYRVKVVSRLRRRNFSTTIQPTYSREWVGDLLVRATKSAQRIGYLGDLNNITEAQKQLTDHWYTQLIHNPESGRSRMELNLNAHFVRELGDASFLSRVPQLNPLIQLPAHLSFKEKYIVLAPGASWQRRIWPTASFIELIARLDDEFSLPIILCGSDSDRELCETLATQSSQAKVINLAGKTTLLELIEVIRCAALLVSNESAPTHIAAATQTPSVCVVGGGHFGRFLPYLPEQPYIGPAPILSIHKMDCYGCKWRCIYDANPEQAVPCIGNVKPADLYDHCYQILNRMP
jgi:ADP-heptose:LPS heptosyltransferase